MGCHLHLGSFVERDFDGRLYNTAVLIDPAGEIAHTYRKIAGRRWRLELKLDPNTNLTHSYEVLPRDG